MPAFVFNFLAVILISILPAGKLAAQSPQDLVQWIYVSLSQPGLHGVPYLSAPERRQQFFSDRLIRLFAANEFKDANHQPPCIGFGVDVSGQDYDAAEILRTLQIEAVNEGTRQIVHARFRNFGKPEIVSYEFAPVDGHWRIDDIAGQGWRLSEIPCDAANVAAPSTELAGYCYVHDGGTLRIELDSTGAGLFDLEIWAATGHFCGIRGNLTPTTTGWLYQEQLSNGVLCRLELGVTRDQGVRINDPQHDCKSHYCGMKAAMDGTEFPRSSQVDCAQVPRDQN